MNYFVTAIGTDSGKTLVSAILCQSLHADYWKPVQSGVPRDFEAVQRLVRNPDTKLHPEQYLLKTPVSPHAAARIDNIEIRLSDFKVPQSPRTLIIEGAGGCLVPLNDRELMIDLIAHTGAQVILVSNHYLGSINHTLLTIEALRNRNIAIKGLVFNGDPQPETERIILQRTKLDCLMRIRREAVIDQAVVAHYAAQLKEHWNE